MKLLEKNKAVELRKQGKTFREILKEIPVSKGSLSCWLRNITLTREQQLARIKYKNNKIKDKFIKYNKLRRQRSEEEKRCIANGAAQEIDSVSEKELKLIGIALYWAEGHKTHARSVDFVNTDPAMVILMMRWLRQICGVQEKQFRIRIQIHNAAGIEKAKEYWSEITGVPLSQFTQAYTKTSPTSKRKSGNLTPYGICGVRISDINLVTKIKGWIRGLMALSSSPV